MNLKFVLIICLASINSLTETCIAQSAASPADLESIRKEVEALKEGQAAILKHLEDIKKQLAARPATPPASAVRDINTDVTIAGYPSRGNQDAKIVLIEFSEYQCPFCGRHYKNTHPKIDEEYIKTGKILYVFRDFPLEFHKLAPKAAEAAHCANDQGKFWEMHDKLFADTKTIGSEHVQKFAEELGLDLKKYNACLEDGKFAEFVADGMSEPRAAGITGTPSFILAVRSPNDASKVKGIKAFSGARPFEFFKTEIDKLLDGAGAAGK